MSQGFSAVVEELPSFMGAPPRAVRRGGSPSRTAFVDIGASGVVGTEIPVHQRVAREAAEAATQITAAT